MRLRNSTEIDNVYLARVVQASCPPGIDEEAVVIFRPVSGFICHGLAWQRGSKFRGSEPLAYVYVARAPHLPLYPPPPPRRHPTSIPGWTVELATIEEVLVYITAHELGHLRYGPSERGAHAWGMRALRKYRRKGLPQPRSATTPRGCLLH